jgi:hypothetical protein
MVNYNLIFLEKTGMMDSDTPWDNTRIEGFLNNYAFVISRDYATPWVDFDTIPDAYQYAVTIYAALQYWWAKAGKDATKFDMQVGGGTTQKSTQLFYRDIEMIDYLKKELEEVAKGFLATDSGDIILGDLVRRSKFSGYLIPRSDDPAGNWLS